jgi:hypothetical protein
VTEKKKYTVADLYTEASKMVKQEYSTIKNGPLSASEEIKMKELAKVISNSVLKEMKLI